MSAVQVTVLWIKKTVDEPGKLQEWVGQLDVDTCFYVTARPGMLKLCTGPSIAIAIRRPWMFRSVEWADSHATTNKELCALMGWRMPE